MTQTIDNSFIDEPERSFYNLDNDDIRILKEYESGKKEIIPLSELSNVVKNIKTVKQKRIYVRSSDRDKAIGILRREGFIDGK